MILRRKNAKRVSLKVVQRYSCLIIANFVGDYYSGYSCLQLEKGVFSPLTSAEACEKSSRWL